MNRSRLLLVPAVALALTLSACSGDDSSATASTDEATGAGASANGQGQQAAQSCPTTPAAENAAPEWTFNGTSGKLEVTGSTDTNAPKVVVGTPFSVAETVVQTLKPGDGPVVGPNAYVSVCYEGVNGRDSNAFDSAYKRGEPAQFSLDGVVPGFKKAIAGQKVGSTVAVAMTPADGYGPQGQPTAGIGPDDTLIFAIKILESQG